MTNTEDLQRLARNKNISYDYPIKGDLRPGSKLSNKLVEELRDRIHYGTIATRMMQGDWEAIDWTLSAFVPPEALDEDKRAQHYDPTRPIATVIPVSLASMDTFLTYFDSVFNRNPLYRYKALGNMENVVRTALMEKICHKQSQWFKHYEAVESALRDSLAYGIGLTAMEWRKKWAYRPYDQEVMQQAIAILEETGVRVNKKEFKRLMEQEVVAEGTRLIPIDPYRAIMDPSVTPERIQDSEYFGWLERHNIMNLLLRENDPEEGFFNMKYVRSLADNGEAISPRWLERASGRNDHQNFMGLTSHKQHQNLVDLSRMYIKLIPKEWELGPEDYPCLYGITLAGEDIIVQCDRLDFAHGQMPVCAVAPTSDGHSNIPVSRMATTYGIQRATDFYINSHNFNCSKAINDMLVVNPRYINEEDILNPGPGKLLRVNEDAYGLDDIRKAVMQLNVSDVTGRHMGDAAQLTEMLRQINGTTDITMGDLSGMPERPTATGVNAAQTGAVSRLQHLSKRISIQYMYDLAWMQAFNNVQFLDMEIQVDAMGRYEQELMQQFGLSNEIVANPLDLTTNFDIDIESYANPSNQNVDAVTQVIQMLLSMEGVGPVLAERIEFIPLFMHWAKLTGAEDMNQFINTGGQMQQMPDEQVQQQVQQGNLVPMEGAMGGTV